MPRIRKKTSKRGTTARRAKIKQKVSESRKKSKKAAKRDPTWKSKKQKDPGIPNNFPYKDQILAEIAEERRQAAETKAQRKEEKKQLRAQQKVALNAGKDGSHGQDSDDAEAEEDDFNGVATLAGPTKSSSKPTRSAPATNGSSGSAPASTTETNGAPLLLNPDLPHLAAVLDKADVVIEVLDARDPLSYRSHALEARVASKEGQRLLLVLNKIDTCPREPTAAWAAHLRSEHPTLLSRAASSFLPPPVAHDPTKGKGKRKEPLDDAWGLDAVSNLLGHWAQEKTGEGPLHVAVVGLTNSGKSAFINSLARKSTLDVYTPSSSTNNPTTTPHALEVTLELNGVSILFIDTPGLAWQHSEEAPLEEKVRRRAQDVLLRNKGRIDRLKDPLPAVSYIVSRAETEDLMVFYCLPVFAKGDVDAFLMGVARAQGLIKKGGKLDLAAAARIVLRDWSTGKLSRYAVPPSAVSGPGTAAKADAVSSALMTIYEGDAALLEKLPPRKEMRRTRDLVRLSSERVDDRTLALDAPWFSTEDGADGVNENGSELESDAEAEEIGSDADADGGDYEEDDADDAGLLDDAEEDEDEDEMPQSSSAQKRKRLAPPSSSKSQSGPTTRPRKKVAFATSVKTTTTNSTRTSSSPSSSYKKSNAKAPAGTKPPPPSRSRKSAANAPPPPTAQKRKPEAGEGTYDFSKFF
ncbi:hypothetical protein F5888DRAFT_1791522 [Russula emetica]|nr:hypothetical protein F5888DRAFT_1791522 [Russula emetica]